MAKGKRIQTKAKKPEAEKEAAPKDKPDTGRRARLKKLYGRSKD